ncbi:MAG: redoxin domain-containing protein [Anaerolineales bacterium]
MDSIARLDEPTPDFELPDLDGKPHRPEEALGKVLVLNFWSAECPWSERADQQLRDMREEWGTQVELWAIASNVNEDMPSVRSTAVERGLPVVLRDQDHIVADRYGAQTTPHFFVVDRDGTLRYMGALDDTTFRKREPERHFLAEAVRAVLAGEQPDPQETPGYGCTIVRHQL